ncbi:MAG: aminotransferase class I/II-fold pyridoxal phosphate-dependent enzyme, partial [Flavobacteriaceae bacterium]|nr:aminotransferase class I/II-fold pyridoxal phosphate-dependent enzyme [Flavobacteriaceae bacterium]
MKDKAAFNTKVIHGGQQPDKAYGAVMPPIYQTSTYAQERPGVHSGYAYSRSANPTRTALEQSLASLEEGTAAMAFASGLAAIDAVMKLLQPGDVVLCTNHLYGGSYRLFKQIYEPLGILFDFVDMTNLQQVENAITTKTKLLWLETPTNPLLHIIDIQAMVQIAKQYQLLTAVDNTFATPYLQQPLTLGVDIVMHSATKYLAGHSDVVLGALVVKETTLAKRLYFIQNASGAIAGPMDSFLTLRGIKTLAVRMQRHIENAAVIASYLQDHPKVEKVYWPGFASHPN